EAGRHRVDMTSPAPRRPVALRGHGRNALALPLLACGALLDEAEAMNESRRFVGRPGAADLRLPPGQHLTRDFPVLSAGPTPHVPLEQWELTIDDGTGVLRRWSWKSFRELPTERMTADLHCVTRWSKLGTTWEGVSVDTLLAGLTVDASFALARSYGGHT